MQAGTGSGGLSWGDGLWLTGEGLDSLTGTRLNRGDLWRGGGSQELGGMRRIQGGTREYSGAGRKLGETGRRTTQQKLNKRKFKVRFINRKSIFRKDSKNYHTGG